MKAILLLVGITCSLCLGQSAHECKPSIYNVPESHYPCVHPDNRATVQVIAPDAKKVELRMAGGHEMTRGS